MNSFLNRMFVAVTLSLTFAAGATGCIAESGEVEVDEDLVSDADESSPLLWSAWISDEDDPVGCGAGRLVSGVDCDGGFCDNVRINCVSAGVSFEDSYYTTYFSEEGVNNARTCGPNEWVTGIDCAGNNCDNVRLQCSTVLDASVGACFWSGFFSEEDGAFAAPPDYYVRGMKCSGSFCDKMSYFCCALD